MKLSKRHIVKTISWRLVVTMDTLLLSWLITSDFFMGSKISAITEDINYIKMSDIARVSTRISKSLFYDAYKKNRQTGSLIIIDERTNETIVAAMTIK